MKRNRILSVLSGAALLMAGACSDDTLNPGKGIGDLGPDADGGVFMTVDFKMPNGIDGNGTRSNTIGDDGQSTGGYEIGYDDENYVTNALVVLASTEEVKQGGEPVLYKYGYIVAGEVRSNHIQNLSNETSNLFKAAAQLSKTNLTSFYELYTETVNGETVTNIPEVYVFVFCNPTKQLLDIFANANTDEGIGFGSDKWVDAICEVVQGNPNKPNENIGIWGTNSFLMNNKNLTTRKLPKRLLDWENYNSYEKAFHLSDFNQAQGQTAEVDNGAEGYGPVIVERSVARFDYKDGAPDRTKPNQYPVLYMSGTDGNINDGQNGRPNQPVVGVELVKMCLVNMGNRFYYLPRVSQNGQLSGATLCGRERAWTANATTGVPTGGNYLVGPWAIEFAGASEMGSEDDLENLKAFYGNDPNGFYKYFNYPFFDANGKYDPEGSVNRWDVVKISDVLNGREDKYTASGAASPDATTAQAGDYKIWRYVVENLIPAGSENQVNGISTGVVFKAKLADALIENGAGYVEEAWNKGAIQNLAKCLNGETFTYNGKDHTLTGDVSKDPILYYFGGTLYMGWRHIRQAAIQASVTINVSGGFEINRSTSLYRAVFGDGPIPPSLTYGKDQSAKTVYIKQNEDGTTTSMDLVDPQWSADVTSTAYDNYTHSADYAWSVWAAERGETGTDDEAPDGSNLDKMREAITGAGITIYQSATDPDEGPGYYCYYFYWNRHNNNYKDGTMGPMEFDVVRNNVYKLSVDAIKRLGHPRIPENDPNSPKPDTPDETDYIYLDVKIDIVPWVVRINSITFDNNY